MDVEMHPQNCRFSSCKDENYRLGIYGHTCHMPFMYGGYNGIYNVIHISPFRQCVIRYNMNHPGGMGVTASVVALPGTQTFVNSQWLVAIPQWWVGQRVGAPALAVHSPATLGRHDPTCWSPWCNISALTEGTKTGLILNPKMAQHNS